MKIQTLKLHGFFFFAWFGCPSESRRIFHNISFVHQIPGMVRKDERLRFEDIPLHDIYINLMHFTCMSIKMNRFDVTQS